MKGAAVLRGIATVFRKPHLHFVAREDSRFVWGVGARDDAKAKHAFVERQRRFNVAYRETHVVALISERLLERGCLHRTAHWPLVSSGACANHSMRPHSAQMRIEAEGSAQSTLKTVRVRVLRSALAGANFSSP